jgi:competence ComEA-like helix-hairpin-helix protein
VSRTESRVLIVLAALALIAMGIRTAHHYGWGRDPVAVVPSGAASLPPIDLNKATWQDLTLLPGIGEVRARRIVAYRERVGEIRDPGELAGISGISAALIERIRPRITVRRLRPDPEK